MLDHLTSATCYGKLLFMDKKEMLVLRLDGFTYQYIADKAKVSRQRVQQILSPPKAIRQFVVEKYHGRCADCGIYVGDSGHVHHQNTLEEDYQDINNLFLLCVSCHRQRHSPNPKTLRPCLICGELTKQKLFCSHKCQGKYLSQRARVKLICVVCGMEFERRRNNVKAKIKRGKLKEVFCSRECWGKWTGEHYGFTRHPPNHLAKISKYEPFASQIIDRLDRGERLYRIAKDIGYKSDNLSILKNIVNRERSKKNGS